MRSTPGDDALNGLLQRRIVFLRGALDGRAGDVAVAQLLHLDRADPQAEIAIYINCPSADLRASLALYDVMQVIRTRIRTVCVGVAAGGAALVLAGGARGYRAGLPNSRITLSESPREIGGRIAELDVRARELVRLRQQVHDLLARHTGQPVERIDRDAEREVWLSADEARAYGILDEIISRPGNAGQGEGFFPSN